jgi:hypothetical protein
VLAIDELRCPLTYKRLEYTMTARLMILNGPNLNLLGVREPHIYGATTLAAIKKSCEEFAVFAGAQLSFHQSNHEGELVDLIQSAREQADALIVNPAAYSFTSIAMFDAFKIFEDCGPEHGAHGLRGNHGTAKFLAASGSMKALSASSVDGSIITLLHRPSPWSMMISFCVPRSMA